jgi:PPP family 3-phenylpropionic acid transporter
MTTQKSATIGDGFAPRLALFYVGIFVASGVQLPFLPVWLAAKGLDSAAIGLVLAVPMVVRMAAVPLVTQAADRHAALRGALIVTALASAAGFALVGLADGFRAILLAMALASAAYTPVMPLADAYALKGLSLRRRAYGPVRLWGSVAFIAGNLGAGLLNDVIPARNLIWLIAGAFAVAAVVSPFLAPLGIGRPAAAAPRPSATALLRSPAFLAVAAAAGLVQASHAVYYGFSTLAWAAQGFDGVTIGSLWAIGVLAEIALFAVSGRLPFGPAALLGLGAVGGVMRWIAMACDPPAALLPVLQCLHGLSFGATHLGAVQYLARETPEGLGATAQGYLSIALGLIMAAAMGVSGLLFGRYGSLAYLAMAAAALAGGLFAFAAHRLSRRAQAA